MTCYFFELTGNLWDFEIDLGQAPENDLALQPSAIILRHWVDIRSHFLTVFNIFLRFSLQALGSRN